MFKFIVAVFAAALYCARHPWRSLAAGLRALGGVLGRVDRWCGICSMLGRWSVPALVALVVYLWRPEAVEQAVDWKLLKDFLRLSVALVVLVEVLAWRDRRLSGNRGFFMRKAWPIMKRSPLGVCIYFAAWIVTLAAILGSWV